MGEPDEVCEICGKPLDLDPPRHGYVMAHAGCQEADDPPEYDWKREHISTEVDDG